MAIKREGAAVRLGDQTGDCDDLCADCCGLWALNGAGRAVVIERLAQLRREVSSEAETVDVILENVALRADTVWENVEYVRWSVRTNVRHALCYQWAWYTVTNPYGTVVYRLVKLTQKLAVL